jgi:hypothetical protein
MSPRISWHAWLVLLRPRRVLARLAAIERAAPPGVPIPSLWQIELGVLRMWHRILFRPETIGTCTGHPVRASWRARLLRFRPIRFPFLVIERAITPWDLSGFLSRQAQFQRHLLGAHHDGTQCVYDLQILSVYPGALDTLERHLQQLVSVDSPRSRWLADLCVFERYHAELLNHVRTIQSGASELVAADADDPDISFWAYLRWCARQPESPAAWWRAWRRGRFQWVAGLNREIT